MKLKIMRKKSVPEAVAKSIVYSWGLRLHLNGQSALNAANGGSFSQIKKNTSFKKKNKTTDFNS